MSSKYAFLLLVMTVIFFVLGCGTVYVNEFLISGEPFKPINVVEFKSFYVFPTITAGTSRKPITDSIYHISLSLWPKEQTTNNATLIKSILLMASS